MTSQPEANAPLMTEVMDAVKSPGVQSSHNILENGDSLSKDDHVLDGKSGFDSTDMPQQLRMKDGCVELPDWSSMVASVLWVQVKADSDGNLCSHFSGDPHLFSPPPSPKKVPLGTSPDSQMLDPTTSLVAKGPPAASDLVSESQKIGQPGHVLSNGNLLTSRFGMKTLKVKMEFGVSQSRLYERY